MTVTESEDHGAFFRGLLREHQYQDVSVCLDPSTAENLVEAKRVQLLIIDREMKRLGGPQLLQRVSASRNLRYVACLLFSKDLAPDAIRLAKDLGKDILKVPLEKEVVWPVISEIIRREESMDDLEVELRRAEGLLSEKQPAAAVEIIRQTTKKAAPSARALTLQGEAQYSLQDFVNAEKSLDMALATQSSFTPALQLLGKVYSVTGRHEQAIHLMANLSDSSPLNIKTLLTFSSVLIDADQLAKAKDVLARVRKLDPGNKETLQELGRVALKEGDLDAAEQILSEWNDPQGMGRLLNNVAVGLVAKNQIDDAIKIYEVAIRAIKQHDSDIILFLQYNLGLAMKRKQNWQLAFALLATCCMNRPHYEKAYGSLMDTVRRMRSLAEPIDEEVLKAIEKGRAQAPQKSSDAA